MYNSPLISTRELSAGYIKGRNKKIVLDNIHLEITSGELVCIAGSNGIGKSTLLKTLAGLLPPISGNIYIRGNLVSSYTRMEMARLISVVLTTRIPVGSLKSREVVSLGRYPYTNWLGLLSDNDENKVNQALHMTGTEGLQSRLIFELSDGQLQKIMIARALAQDSEIILLDEPTAHLDLTNKIGIMKLLKDLSSKTGKSILIATHELELAFQVADRLILISEIGALETGTPEDLILAGAIDKFMEHSPVSFDKVSGKFHAVREPGPVIKIAGSGTSLTWTKNALERNGYSVSEDGGLALIVIEAEENRISWNIKYQNTAEIVHSIRDLIINLDRFFKHV